MDPYLLLKSVHLVGVVLFVGNIVVTGWWKVMADRTGDPRIVAFAQRQVTLTDWVFTLGGVSLVAVGGIGNALWHNMPLTTPWLLAGNILFLASGIIWVAILLPLQRKLGRMARAFAAAPRIPAAYWPAERLWLAFGILATVLPLAAIPVMVWKFA
ncbi:MAG: DUF2269 domain-containing protein [Magnetospirillum sp.]|nr:DUF2269 domain-containing protein [Magnetospirillum sp.]